MAILTFRITNNEVEYEVLIARLSTAKALATKQVEVKVDSQIVVNQVTGAYATKEEKLKKYLEQLLTLRDQFKYFFIMQIPRVDNSVANRLARAASAKDDAKLLWEVGTRMPKWAIEIENYLEIGKLPEMKGARKIKRKAAQFVKIGGVLYKKGFTIPLLGCISPKEA